MYVWVMISHTCPVLAFKVEAATPVLVVDLAIRPRAGAAPEGDALVPDAPEHRIEFLVGSQEGVVVGARVVRVVEIESQRVVDLDRGEVSPSPLVFKSEDAGR